MSQLFEESSEIAPVWQELPRFFRYPFKSRILPVIAAISAAMVLTVIPILGFFIGLLLWAMLFKLSYEILNTTASGMMEGPPSVTRISGGIMFKHIGLLLALGLGYGLIAGAVGSIFFALLLGLFLMLAMPASIMTLAMTQSLIKALNPLIWIQLMQTTGWAYLLTSAFLLLMLLSQTQAEALLLPLVGGSMVLFTVVSTFISAYFMAASFHLMGYLLYQYHDELGIEVSLAAKREREQHEDKASQHPLIEEAAERVAQGQADEAVQVLGEQIRRSGAEPEVHDYYRKLLLSRDDKQALLDHGRQYVPVLLHAFESEKRALEVVAECQQIDPAFRPERPGDILPLARLAFKQGRDALVLRLTSGFGKRHRDHPDLVENYFLAARSMIRQGESIERPLGIVRKLRKRFPDHPLVEEMASFEARIEAPPAFQADR